MKFSFNIKNELDKLKGITTSDIDLKKQVLLSKNMPDHIKKICLEKLEELKNANNEKTANSKVTVKAEAPKDST